MCCSVSRDLFSIIGKEKVVVLFYNNYIFIMIEYTELGGNEELPLGEEFQSLVKVFINPHEKKAERKYELYAVLIEQLQ